MKTIRVYTKRPMKSATLVRMYEDELTLLRHAAGKLGLSQSEFIRRTLRETSTRILSGNTDEQPAA